MKFLIGTFMSFFCLMAIILIILHNLPGRLPTQREMPHPQKDVTPLPPYAQYVNVQTDKDVILKVLEVKNPNVKEPQPLIAFFHV